MYTFLIFTLIQSGMMFLAELFALSFASLVVAQDTNLRTVVNTFNQFNVSIIIDICNGLLHIVWNWFYQVTRDTDIVFDPTILLEVAFPQASGNDVPVHAGVQLPRNR